MGKKIGLLVIVLGAATALYYGFFDKGGRYPQSEYRHRLMETVANSSAVIFGQLSGRLPALEGHSLHHAEILSATAHMAKEAFSEDTRALKGRSDSKDAVWQDWDDFSKKMDDFVEKTDALVVSLQSGDQEQGLAAMKAVYGTCKDCHQTYRK